MNHSLTAFFASSLLAMTLVPAATTASHAFSGKAVYNVNKLQNQGFRACKALGDTGYTGVVRGTTLNGTSLFSERGFPKFYVRSCFETKAECTGYVNTFAKRLIGVNEISYRSCKRTG
jgi:hypothetical protein